MNTVRAFTLEAGLVSSAINPSRNAEIITQLADKKETPRLALGELL